MAFLSQSTASQIQQRMVAAFTSAALSGGVPVSNAGPGGTLGAVLNAINAESQDLQSQIAYVAALTRLQTSASQTPGVNSPDVDSFLAQFGSLISRNPAVKASTKTTIWSSPSPAPSGGLTIAVGTYCQAAPNTQFVVIADATQPGYNAGLNAYVIASGATSVAVTVQAIAAGTSGNVQANTITQILALPNAPAPTGVNAVTNTAAITNGANPESDAAVIARFQALMAGRWANPQGVYAAVDGAQGGLTFQIGDMLTATGTVQPNFFSVIFNVLGQSSGPTSDIIALVNAAVQANRPCGMPYTVVAPVLDALAISATLSILPNAVANTVLQNAANAVTTYLNTIGLANGIFTDPSGATTRAKYAEVSAILLETPGVTNVTGLLLNGGTLDFTAPFGAQIVAGNVTLTAA